MNSPVNELPDRFKQACANPLCTNRFTAKNVQQRYCSEKCAGKLVAPFIAVDGEGVGRGKDHKYVLLGVGSVQREWPDGVKDFTEVCEFLYGCYESNRDTIFTGFYLGYDFNMWLRLLPRERAAMLFSAEGIRKRQPKSEQRHFTGPFPVEYRDWEFDILAAKRFKLKPKGSSEWLYICDAGPFFQSSLLTAIDPGKWVNPVITAEEYETVKTGKERRADAKLDDEMRAYNRLENDILARLMTRYREGLAHASVELKKQQWFGPGQAAQKWLRVVGTLDRPTKAVRDRAKGIPAWWDAAKATYYGGWFEIMVHGHIPGVTYEYDINSAYPFVAASLPCVCGDWEYGNNTPSRIARASLCLAYVVARGKSKYLGGLPYRNQDGSVLRPNYTKGWYWVHEIDAAKRAGLIDEVTYYEWYAYKGCHHDNPLRLLSSLYDNRLRIGKDTPEGKAFKLIYNSVYGKLCQSQGENPPFSNAVYASLITAGCREMILGAIATHPQKAEAVAMVATDGVYFLTPHPTLPISQKLGEWDTAEHENLTLFKPGIYWSDETRQQIVEGVKPQFKARGINAEDFSRAISTVDAKFRLWQEGWMPGMPPGRKDWPTVDFHARFSQTTVKQAVQWTEGIDDPAKQIAVYRNLAGAVKDDRKLRQDSYPAVKRNIAQVGFDGRVWRSEPWPGGPHWPESKPYDKSFGLPDEDGFAEFVTPDAPVLMQFREVIGG